MGAFALTLLGVLASAPGAQAAFTSTKCAGADITGRGASFARDAHNAWILNFRSSFCAGTVGHNTIGVTYEALGSGAGRTSVKDRTLAPRFGMSDEPPTPTEIQQMNVGDTGDT
jgi:ABC-type phosphate transport system substrate-binding protein